MKRSSHVDIPNPFSHSEYKPMFLQSSSDPAASDNRLSYAGSISSQPLVRNKRSTGSFTSQQQSLQGSTIIHRNELTKRISIIEKNINELESILNDASSVIIGNDDTAANPDEFYDCNDNRSIVIENNDPQFVRFANNGSQTPSELRRASSLSSDMMKFKLNELKNKLSNQITAIDSQSEYAASINDNRSIRSIDSSATRFRNGHGHGHDDSDLKSNIDVLKHRVIQKRLSDTTLSSKIQHRSSYSNMKDSLADAKLYIIPDTSEKSSAKASVSVPSTPTAPDSSSSTVRIRGLRYSQYASNVPNGKLYASQDPSSDIPPPRSELRYRDKTNLNSTQYAPMKPPYIQAPSSSLKSVRPVRSLDSLRYSDIARLVDASKLQQLNAVRDLSEKRVDVIRQKLNNTKPVDSKTFINDTVNRPSSASSFTPTTASSHHLTAASSHPPTTASSSSSNAKDNTIPVSSTGTATDISDATSKIVFDGQSAKQASPAFDASVYDPEILHETTKYLTKYDVEGKGNSGKNYNFRSDDKNEEKDKLSELKSIRSSSHYNSNANASSSYNRNSLNLPAPQVVLHAASTPSSPHMSSSSSFTGNSNSEIPYRDPNHLSYHVSKRRSFNTLKNSTVVQSYNGHNNNSDSKLASAGSNTAAAASAAVAAASSYSNTIIRPVKKNTSIPVSPSLNVLDSKKIKKRIGNLNSSISMNNINIRRHHNDSDRVEAVAYDGKDILVAKKSGFFKKFVHMFKKK